MARLADPVLDLYGVDQCRRYLDGLEPSAFEVRAVRSPEPWDYGARDGRAVRVEAAIPVDVTQVVGDRRVDAEAHLVRAGDGTLRWFTDCGTPR